MKVFIDSNIPMYVAGRDHPNREPARRFLERVRAGEVEGCTSTEVLQEILYRYAALRRLDLAGDVDHLLRATLSRLVLAVTLADTDRARAMVGRATSIGVRDAIHAAVMLNNEIASIATFDSAFDHIPGVSRLSL